MKKNLSKIVLGIILVMTLGWFGSLFFGRYLTPLLIRNDFFSKMGIFDNDNKNTTIINKTEKILVKEDDSITEISSNAVYSVVNVFSFAKEEKEKSYKTVSSLIESTVPEGKNGAGTILTNDGIIVTHRSNIIEKEADYKVLTFGGNVLEATLLGVDDFTDLAFLKVTGINLTTMPMANSDEVNYGKKVIIIGRISGLQKVFLTEGILSGFNESFSLTGTEIASSEKLEGVFNTNFIGNGDYVGGPMINYNGELLGINAIISKDSEKYFFQIPINSVKDSMQKIVENRIEQSAKLGVYYLPLDSYYKSLKNLTVDRGALIYSATGKQGLAVIANSSAEKAGIKIGDVILSIDGNEINSAAPLSDFINQYEKGNSAVLNVLREGKEIEITVEF